MENLEHSTKIMKVAVSCSQVQPVWAGNILVLRNQKMLFSCICCSLFTGDLVRLGLRHATANNEDGARVDVYAPGSGKVRKHLKAFLCQS